MMYGIYVGWIRQEPFPWRQTALRALAVAVAGYFGGLLLWPYGLMAPLTNPLKAFSLFSNFIAWNENVFFEGHFIKADSLPWYYLPKWLLISSPFFLITGLCLAVFFIPRLFREKNTFFLAVLLWGALSPLLYIIGKHSITYDSWRHVLFIYPLWIVLIAYGWQVAWSVAKRSGAWLLLAWLLLFQTAEPALWMIRNHRHEYVYFNALAGGLPGALYHYETDYWGNSLRQGAEWLADFLKKNGAKGPIQIRADGSIMSSYPYLHEKLWDEYRPFAYPRDFLKSNPLFFLQHPPLYLYQVSFSQPWDYALVLTRNWPLSELKTKWPPQGTIHTVQAEGIPLCAVVKNPRRNRA